MKTRPNTFAPHQTAVLPNKTITLCLTLHRSNALFRPMHSLQRGFMTRQPFLGGGQHLFQGFNHPATCKVELKKVIARLLLSPMLDSGGTL